ncbi:MAG: hypothetical protein ACYCZY_02295 [Lacisediminihabitans sp.]
MTAIPVLKKILAFGGILAGVIAGAGSVIGYLVAGGAGVISALIGTAMAVVFLGITAVSILIASRYSTAAFFGIVMGAWLLKFAVFLILVFVLKDQPWIQSGVMFLSLVVAVIGTLAVDLVVIARSRLPYVSDVTLPGPPSGDDQP